MLGIVRLIFVGSLDDQDWLGLTGLGKRHLFVRSSRQWSDVPDDVEQFEEHFRA